jgi:hypothetical protein
MVGTRPRNLHEGSRSEILADYLFSAWGTVTPVRWQDDFGIDLFCTLNELAERAWRVKAYYTVQVKSAETEWPFAERDEVEWLIHHPTPLFLCAIDKKAHRARIYQTFPRFYLWANGIVPNSLSLKPGLETAGAMPTWAEGAPCSLSAPIIEVGVDDLTSNERMQQLWYVLDYWIQRDRENCDRVRQGLLQLTMPPSYIVNELPRSGIGSMGRQIEAPNDLIHRGLRCLGAAAETIGSQLAISDPELALRATLLLSWLQKHYADALNDDPFLRMGRGTGQLYGPVCRWLNEAHGDRSFTLAGLDEIERQFENNELVREYVRRAR